MAYRGLVLRGVRKMGTYIVRTYLRYVLRVIKTHRFGVIGQTDHGPVTGLRKWSRGKLGKWESGKIRKILVTILQPEGRLRLKP